MDRITLTKEMIDAGMSANGGWSSIQVQLLGLPSLTKGWQQRLIGTQIDRSAYDLFLELKDVHRSALRRAKGRGKRTLKIVLSSGDYDRFAAVAAKFSGRTLEEVAYRALAKYCEPHKVLLQDAPKPPQKPDAPAPVLGTAELFAGGAIEKPRSEMRADSRPNRPREGPGAGSSNSPADCGQAPSELRPPSPGAGARPRRGLPEHFGESWTAEEQAIACSDLMERVPVKDTAAKLGRTRGESSAGCA